MNTVRTVLFAGLAAMGFNAAAKNIVSYEEMEASFNSAAEKIPGTPQVLLLDGAAILQEGGDNIFTVIDQKLIARGADYKPAKILDFVDSVRRQDPSSTSLLRFYPMLSPQELEKTVCVVVAYPTDVTVPVFLASMMKPIDPRADQRINLLEDFNLNIAMSFDTYKFHVTTHELWHCLDTRYTPKVFDENGAVAFQIHRSEVFAEVGAVLETVQTSGDMSFIDALIDMRVAREGLSAPLIKGLPAGQPYYPTVYYNFMPPLNAAKAAIEAMGMEKLKTLSRAELRDIAYEITDAYALDNEKWNAMKAYYVSGGKAEGYARQYAAQAEAVRERTKKVAVPRNR